MPADPSFALARDSHLQLLSLELSRYGAADVCKEGSSLFGNYNCHMAFLVG